MSNDITDYIDSVARAAAAVDTAAVEACIDCLEAAYRDGRGVYVIGNGGSAANASHFAQDLAKGALPTFPAGKRFRVLSLTDNIAFITALANDIGYEHVFELQLRQFAQSGDVLIAISGSGKSPNILRAVAAAREIGMVVVGVTGYAGGPLRENSDIRLHVPLNDMCKTEAVHSVLMHAVVDRLRERIRRCLA